MMRWRFSTTKRTVLVLTLLLVCGAIINVAVALVTSISKTRSHHTGIWLTSVANSAADESLWNRRATSDWGNLPKWHSEWYGPFSGGRAFLLSVNGSFIIPMNATIEQLREIYRGAGSYEIWQANFGFPLRTARIEEWSAHPMDSRLFATIDSHDGLVFNKYRVPQTILWPGFAINTIFYAAILWLLFAIPGFARRRIRIKRGQCPACAYPIGESPICTECGTPIPGFLDLGFRG